MLCGKSISYPCEDVEAEVETSNEYYPLFAFLCSGSASKSMHVAAPHPGDPHLR